MNIVKNIVRKFDDLRFRKKLSIIKEYKGIEGWLTEYEAFGLYSTASKLPAKSIIIEIGSWKGKSTYCLAMGLKNGNVFAIDPFNADGETGSKDVYENIRGELPLLDQFINNMNRLGVDSKVEPLKGYSKQFISKFNNIDFLFIDGDHSIAGCDFDFLNYAHLIKKGGFIAFHDFYVERDELGPTWVIKNRIQKGNDFKFLKKYDSLWVGQKLK
jgi:MMP 1-O-methyltransferase